MENTKWDELPYKLKTDSGERSLVFLSNFQKTENGWFDTGHYTVTENAVKIGDIYVDLYTDDGISWNGPRQEFTSEQLYKMVSFITSYDIKDADLPF